MESIEAVSGMNSKNNITRIRQNRFNYQWSQRWMRWLWYHTSLARDLSLLFQISLSSSTWSACKEVPTVGHHLPWLWPNVICRNQTPQKGSFFEFFSSGISTECPRRQKVQVVHSNCFMNLMTFDVPCYLSLRVIWWKTVLPFPLHSHFSASLLSVIVVLY